MWSAWGTVASIRLSSSGFLSFGGTSVGHEFRPLTDQFNERGELDEARRISRLPLSWSIVQETSNEIKTLMSNKVAIVGDIRLPERISSVFSVYTDFVFLTAALPEAQFFTAYDALKAFLAAVGPKEYVLTSEFLGARHPDSDSLVPTAPQFYVEGHPYVVEEAVALSFNFGNANEIVR